MVPAPTPARTDQSRSQNCAYSAQGDFACPVPQSGAPTVRRAMAVEGWSQMGSASPVPARVPLPAAGAPSPASGMSWRSFLPTM